MRTCVANNTKYLLISAFSVEGERNEYISSYKTYNTTGIIVHPIYLMIGKFTSN